MTQPKVNADNFARAESHRMFADLQRNAGGVNRFAHNRAPASVDQQTVIRLNRDTLYSFAVVDVLAGATLTVPDAGERYLSVMVVNEDHHINRVLHDPGRYELPAEELGTSHAVVAARVLVDPRESDDVDTVVALQDLLDIDAADDRPFQLPEYDTDSFDRTRKALLALASDMSSFERRFGRAGDVDPVHHLIGAAAGSGGLPDAEATYVGVSPGLPVGEYELTVGDVPVDGFWSISVHNADGYFEPTTAARSASTTSPPLTPTTAASPSDSAAKAIPRRTRSRSPTAGTISAGSTTHARRSSTAAGPFRHSSSIRPRLGALRAR